MAASMSTRSTGCKNENNSCDAKITASGHTVKQSSEDLLNIKPNHNPHHNFLLLSENKNAPPAISRLPASSVLSRVKNFLPNMEASNIKLQERIRQEGEDAVNLENVEEDAQYVEMNLALVEGDWSSGDEDDDDSDSSSSDSELTINCVVTESNLKLPNSSMDKKSGCVQVISDGQSEHVSAHTRDRKQPTT